LRSNLNRLLKTPVAKLLEARYAKFRRLGNFAEIPTPPNGASA
jgi:hypothetical protein